MLAALTEERAEKRNLMTQFQAMQAQLSELNPIREELTKRQQEATAKAEQEAFEANPAEYLRKQQEALAQRMDAYRQQQDQVSWQQQQLQQFHQSVSMEATEYSKRVTDYPDAFGYVRDRRMAEYAVLGVPPEQAQSLFDQESWGLAVQARQHGKSAPEMVMELAKLWGYQQKTGTTTAGNVTNISDKIKRVEAGMKASATLSGGLPTESSVLKKVEAMSDAEFDEFWDKEVTPEKGF